MGQLIDSILLMVFVFGSLMLSLFYENIASALGLGAEDAAAAAATGPVTWESLGQNDVMQAQWEKLGYSVNDAAALINDRFDYTIDPVALIITAIVIIGYFVFLFRASDKEYREVLREKFDQ
jgi:hypothetical protein